MKKETEYIIQLIVKRLQGGLSPEEETFFTAWKSRSKANEELYERLENEYEEHTEYPLYEQFNARRSWPSVMKDIRKRHSIRRLYRGVAAAAIVLLSVSDVFDGRGESTARGPGGVGQPFFFWEACLADSAGRGYFADCPGGGGHA